MVTWCPHGSTGLSKNLDTSPKSEPALELKSRAVPSVKAHHPVSGPNTGRNSGGRRIKNKYRHFGVADEGGVLKKVKICMTSFMNDPICFRPYALLSKMPYPPNPSLHDVIYNFP